MATLIGFLAAAVVTGTAIALADLLLGEPRDDFYRAARSPEEAAAKHRAYTEARAAGE